MNRFNTAIYNLLKDPNIMAKKVYKQATFFDFAPRSGITCVELL